MPTKLLLVRTKGCEEVIIKPITTYVISVKSFKERQQAIYDQCKRCGLLPTFVFEFDPSEAEVQKEFEFARELPLATRSTLLKHLAAQRRLLESPDEFALVLEDDAILFDDFLDGLEKAINFASTLEEPRTIFLGGADNKLVWPNELKDTHCIIRGELTTAEAYLIDRSGSERRFQWLKDHTINLAADHLLKYVDQNTGVAQYRCVPPVATQGSITGKFKTTLDTNRSQKSLIFLRIRFEWKKLLRLTLPLLFLKFKKLIRRALVRSSQNK